LLLIVVDAGHPRVDDHLAVVAGTLAEIGADAVPQLLLLNKCDTPAAAAVLPDLRGRFPDAVPVSALQRDGLEEVKRRVDDALSRADAYRQSGRHDPAGA
jgi:GTP-binding protein HflX